MKRNTGPLVILVSLAFFNFLAWLAIFSSSSFLEVVFFDVGQGDAIFIETPQDHQVLIDGGPDTSVLEKLGKEMPFWDKNIDLLILTHPDHDHLAGLIEVLQRYKVDNVLWTGVVKDTAEYAKWLELLEEQQVIIAQAGQRIILSDVIIDVLFPFNNLEGESPKDINNTSIVLRLSFKESSFLFTGDLHKSLEEDLVEKQVFLASDILKISHHGSKTSSSEKFIEYVSPEIAVISVGRNNSYGHPHQETLETLKKYDIRVERTDQRGDIKILSDGVNHQVKTFKNI